MDRLHELYRREFEALRKDYEYRKGWKGVTARPLSDLWEDLNRYPSILTRTRRAKNRWLHRLSWPARTCRRTRWFIQRGQRGYSDFDLYNFDQYLAFVISAGAQQIKEDTYSYPPNFDDSIEWDEVLDRISHGFEVYLIWRDRHSRVSKDHYMDALHDTEKELQTSIELLGKWFSSLQA